jgi:hypothetical protein
MSWQSIVLAIIAVPIGIFILYVAGRALIGGAARSWFEAKRQYNDEQRKQGGEHEPRV